MTYCIWYYYGHTTPNYHYEEQTIGSHHDMEDPRKLAGTTKDESQQISISSLLMCHVN